MEEYNMTADTSRDSIDDSGSTIHKYNQYLKYRAKGAFAVTPTSKSGDSILVTNWAVSLLSLLNWRLFYMQTGEQTAVGYNSYDATYYTPSELGCTHSCSSSSSSSSSSYSSSSSSSNCYSQSTCDNCMLFVSPFSSLTVVCRLQKQEWSLFLSLEPVLCCEGT